MQKSFKGYFFIQNFQKSSICNSPISHLYGGNKFTNLDRELFNENNIIISTPEKAKALTRTETDLLSSLKLIVVDEGHLIGNNERDIKNELFLEHLRTIAHNNDIKIILLSAVLPNAQDLATWITGDPANLVKSDWKPSSERFGVLHYSKNKDKIPNVTINWISEYKCFNPKFIEPRKLTYFDHDKNKYLYRKFPKDKGDAIAETAIKLSKIGSVLIFIGNANNIASMARRVIELHDKDDLFNWVTLEWNLFKYTCIEELGKDSIVLRAAKYGILCHSNKLPAQTRLAMEKLLAKQAPNIIIATTTTLAQGVNIGVSSVIFSTTYIGGNPISNRDFWNICGRAGRAFIDNEGKILYSIDNTKEPWQIQKDMNHFYKYIDINHMDSVNSGLLSLISDIIKIAQESNISFDLLLELIANNDLQKFENQFEYIQKRLDLIDDQLLSFHLDNSTDIDNDSTNWVDSVFSESLASIQSKIDEKPILNSFIKSRVVGVIKLTHNYKVRKCVISSSLPLSISLKIISDLNNFKDVINQYIASDKSQSSLNDICKFISDWAIEHAEELLPPKKILDYVNYIRSFWISGSTLSSAVDDDFNDIDVDISNKIAKEFYGEIIPWIIHGISQALRIENEEENEYLTDQLSEIGTLIELGLPNYLAVKVFLSSIRSRTSALELSNKLTNPSISIKNIRVAIIEVKDRLLPVVSEPTKAWIQSIYNESNDINNIKEEFPSFTMKGIPDNVTKLHARADSSNEYLCSTDLVTYKIRVTSNDDFPFSKIANNNDYIFIKKDNAWYLECRNPRLK